MDAGDGPGWLQDHVSIASGSTSSAGLLAGSATAEKPLSEPDARALEEVHFKRLLSRLHEQYPAADGFSRCCAGLALSGGGTRAAAFHCGVIWSMASAGLLKDVKHLSAVSGGGYTAASYVTHLCHAATATPAGSDADQPGLDAWYQRVVGRFILRMQCNINYLVETTPMRLWRLPREEVPEEAGSSCCPRALDLVLLLGALVGSMAASPLLLILQTLWPIVLSVEFSYGARLRSAWCDPFTPPWESVWIRDWARHSLGLTAILAFIAVALGFFHWMQCCPATAEHHRRYLCSRSVRHIFERGAICLAVYNLLVLFVLWLQFFNWGHAASPDEAGQWVRALCHHYISGSVSNVACSDFSSRWSTPWYQEGDSVQYLNDTWVSKHALPPAGRPWDIGLPLVSSGGGFRHLFGYLGASVGFSGMVVAGLGVLVLRSALLRWLLTILGPLCYLIIVAHIVRWELFGPLTMQMLLPTAAPLKYTHTLSTTFLWICVAGALLTLPVYDAVQKLAHLYYRRALKRAFFYGGHDVSFASIANNPYCPNLIFCACLHDYRKPGDGPNFSEFTMSSLFVGSHRTGYFGTPSQASLARLMTIAGAATDATVLLNADVLGIRFILAVIALRFGDFLRLQPDGQLSMRIEGRIADSFGGQPQFRRVVRSVHEQHWISRWLQGLIDRLPAACPFIAAHILLVIGALLGSRNSSEATCPIASTFLVTALLLFGAVITLSFFAYLRPLQWLMTSPMIQQFQMLVMHRYIARDPPPYVYISDGGLLEVLGLLPLLRRRLDRIVVSDAAEDPALSMRCLRDAIALCRKERLCSFYDLNDPYRDMEFVLQAFRESDMSVLHLGIQYESSADDGAVQHGELFYVRMRLRPDDCVPTRWLLTEQELLRPHAPTRQQGGHQSAGPRLRRDLSGVCCHRCECGGLCVGRRFPDFGVSNQFLTPFHFANLCSLGAELSEPMVRAMATTSDRA